MSQLGEYSPFDSSRFGTAHDYLTASGRAAQQPVTPPTINQQLKRVEMFVTPELKRLKVTPEVLHELLGTKHMAVLPAEERITELPAMGPTEIGLVEESHVSLGAVIVAMDVLAREEASRHQAA